MRFSLLCFVWAVVKKSFNVDLTYEDNLVFMF